MLRRSLALPRDKLALSGITTSRGQGKFQGRMQCPLPCTLCLKLMGMQMRRSQTNLLSALQDFGTWKAPTLLMPECLMLCPSYAHRRDNRSEYPRTRHDIASDSIDALLPARLGLMCYRALSKYFVAICSHLWSKILCPAAAQQTWIFRQHDQDLSKEVWRNCHFFFAYLGQSRSAGVESARITTCIPPLLGIL